MAICFPVLLIAGTLGILINNIGTYTYIIDRYKITLITGIDEAQLEKIYQHWIDFYNNKTESPQYQYAIREGHYRELLSEKELVHLQDVKDLVWLDYTVFAFTFVLLLICIISLIIINRNRCYLLFLSVFRGSLLTVALFMVMLILSVCCFDKIFVLFHLISFSNEFWILDPATDYLIMMFPGGFFFDIVFIASCSILVTAIILGSVSFGLLKVKYRQ